MLSRVLEPEVMDSPKEALEYDTMDHSAVNADFAEALAELLGGDAPAGPMLDVGAGTALIPIEICRRLPRARLVAIDLSRAMLELGQRRLDEAGFAEQVSLQLVDAKALPYADGAFDVVISNSIVHHIPEPRRAMRELSRVLRPGGALLVRDLLRPDDEATLAQLVQRHAGTASPHQRALFEASLWAALRVDEVRALVSELGLPASGVTQSSDRHWTWRVAPDRGRLSRGDSPAR
jgi:ubiquinone/menaquinone biosynthesis C-methylase UbiE